MSSGVSNNLKAVHHVSATETWVGGEGPTLLRWDGEVFTPVALPPVRYGADRERTVYSIAGSIDGPHGLWVLVSRGELVELRTGAAPRIHALNFDGSEVTMPTPDELVVVGIGQSIVRRRF